MNIVFCASNYLSKQPDQPLEVAEGNYLYIDDVAVVYGSGIDEATSAQFELTVTAEGFSVNQNESLPLPSTPPTADWSAWDRPTTGCMPSPSLRVKSIL